MKFPESCVEFLDRLTGKGSIENMSLSEDFEKRARASLTWKDSRQRKKCKGLKSRVWLNMLQ